MTTYGELKTMAKTLYGNSVGAGNFIESDSGSPSQLAMFFHFIHSRIVGYPHTFPFCKIIGTITSTGATEYNLGTLFPDFLSLYQVFEIDENQEHTHFGNSDGNTTTVDGWHLRNKMLIFTGTPPASGSTFKIQYKSQYLVESSAGVRKEFFEDEDDVSVLDIADVNVLIFGIGSYVNWNTDEVSKEKRLETKDWFQEAWTNLLLRGDVDKPVSSLL